VGRWVKRIGLASCALFALLLIVGLALESTRWRLFLVGRKLRGDVRELTWGELFHMLGPSSRYYLRPMILEGRSVTGVIQNPFSAPADIDQGNKLFRARCAPCHGHDAVGDRAPPLNRPAFSHGNADWVVYRILQRGIAGTGMPPATLSEQEIWQVIAFLRMRQNEAAGGATQDNATRIQLHVTQEDLVGAPSHPDEWLTHARTFDGWRYSPLTEVSTANVAKLRLLWVHQLATNDAIVEATPLVAGGAMFLSEPPSGAVALEAKTGKPLWRFGRDLPLNMSLCCARVNRGVALLGNSVFLGTLDAHLIALDATSGAVRWETKVADSNDGYSITGTQHHYGGRSSGIHAGRH